MITIYADNDDCNRPVISVGKSVFVMDVQYATPVQAYRAAQEIVSSISKGIELAILETGFKRAGAADVTIHKNGNSKISSIAYLDRHG